MALSLRPGWRLWAGLGLGCGLALGASLLLLGDGPATATATGSDPPCQPGHPCLAVVIDDVGRDLRPLRQLLRMPVELTYAVLPHARHTESARRAIAAAGREILLHLPMDPLDRSRITDEPVVVTGLVAPGPSTRACLARVPEAVGVNNHMGSALSADATGLAGVVTALASSRRLLVLDSRTSERSVFCQVAGERGLPCLERDVFLDDPPVPGAITSAWERAVEIARRRGWAVAIGHPHPVTVTELRELLRRGEIRLVRLSRLVNFSRRPLTGQNAGI